MLINIESKIERNLCLGDIVFTSTGDAFLVVVGYTDRYNIVNLRENWLEFNDRYTLIELKEAIEDNYGKIHTIYSKDEIILDTRRKDNN